MTVAGVAVRVQPVIGLFCASTTVGLIVTSPENPFEPVTVTVTISVVNSSVVTVGLSSVAETIGVGVVGSEPLPEPGITSAPWIAGVTGPCSVDGSHACNRGEAEHRCEQGGAHVAQQLQATCRC